MRVLYVEVTIDHHSLPLAYCLRELLPDGCFAYAGLEPLDNERQALGWSSGEPLPWMLPDALADKNAAEFCEWWRGADAVMCSARLYGLMEQRIRGRKYVYYTSERWFKPPIGRFRLLHPIWAWKALKYRRLAMLPYTHYLAIGAYAATDMQWFCPMSGRLWSWAYFTASSTISSSRCRDTGFQVLWAGRMLAWKRVDTLIRAFSEFLKTRPDAKLTLLGDGSEKDRLVRLAADWLPQNACAFLPSVTPVEVREHMRNSHVYVLPSNGYEGWGAVINEAMTEGCVVVASEQTGAGKTLIKDDATGMLFHCGDERRLAGILSELGADNQLRQRLANAGKRTIDEIWSPAVGAERFLSVADALLAGRTAPVYCIGPMSLLCECQGLSHISPAREMIAR